jgi:hypothetical protein
MSANTLDLRIAALGFALALQLKTHLRKRTVGVVFGHCAPALH